MIPLLTEPFTAARPVIDDLAELPSTSTALGTVMGRLVDLAQMRAGRGVDGADMVLVHRPGLELQNNDVVTDAAGQEWIVISWSLRTGLGLDHGVGFVRRQDGHNG